jgi:Receptor family ligand binding region.
LSLAGTCIPRVTYNPQVTYSEGLIDLYTDINSPREKNDIVVALNLPYTFCDECHDVHSGSSYHSGKYYASAAGVAVEDINNDKNLLAGFRLRYLWNTKNTDTHCFEKDAIRIMMGQLNMNISGFIGFNCFCRTVSKMASALNLPLFSMVRFSCFAKFLAFKNVTG